MLTGSAVFAQFANAGNSRAKHNQYINSLLQQNTAAAPVAKSTAPTLERVVAQSKRDNSTNMLVDSIHLKYSSWRGSTYDYNTMIYPYNYPYATSPMFNFLGVFTKPQVLYDTALRWTVNPFTNIYGPYELTYAKYDSPSNHLRTFKDIFVDSTHNDLMTYADSFNSAHNIVLGYWFNLNLGIEDSAFKQYFQYNTSNKLVKDSVYERHLGVWRLASKTNYTYDASDNLTQIDQFTNVTDTSFLLPLIEYQKFVNTYDASNRLLTVLTSLYNGTTLAQSMKDTFAYSGTLTYYNSWKQHQFDPINNYWAPMISVQKHITAGKPDTINTYGFDSLADAWVPAQMDIMHYNAANNPDTMRTYLYNWTSFPATPDYKTIYYYETYTDASSVAQAPVKHNAIVYPNPVTNMLTVALPDQFNKTRVTITFMNMAGQILSRQAMTWQGDARISAADLAPGTYSVVIQNEGGNVIDCMQVVKQ